jgi:hypothetical protein
MAIPTRVADRLALDGCVPIGLVQRALEQVCAPPFTVCELARVLKRSLELRDPLVERLRLYETFQ